jgi:hypothetical protein
MLAVTGISYPKPSLLNSFKLDSIDGLTKKTFRELFLEAQENDIPSYPVAAVKYNVVREGEKKWKFLDGVTFFLDSYKEQSPKNIKKTYYFALKCFEFNEICLEHEPTKVLVTYPLPALFPDFLQNDNLMQILFAAMNIENSLVNGKAQFCIGHVIASHPDSTKDDLRLFDGSIVPQSGMLKKHPIL